MHSYLKSIGFSHINTKEEEENLLNEIIRYSNRKSLVSLSHTDTTQYAEYSCDVAPNIGITVRGQLDEQEILHRDHYFPYLTPRTVTTTEELFIGKKSDNDSYGGLCEDFRVNRIAFVHGDLLLCYQYSNC